MRRCKDVFLAHEWVFIGGITLCAVLLYCYKLELRSYTNDELGTILTGKLDLTGLMNIVKVYDIHPPTHYLLVHFFAGALNESLWLLRFISVVPIIVLIPLYYYSVKKYFTQQVALLSVVFFILSPNILYYFRIVRYYSWTLLFASLSIVLLAKLINKYNKRNAAYYIFATVSLYYFQYLTFALVVVSENILWLYSIYKNRKTKAGSTLTYWLTINAIIMSLILPLFVTITINQFLSQLSVSQNLPSSAANDGINIMGIILAFVYPLYSIAFSQNIVPWDLLYTIPTGLVTIGMLYVIIKFFHGNNRLVIPFLSFVILPLGLTAFLMFKTKISMAITQSGVYSLFIIPIVLIVYAVSIENIKNRLFRYGIICALLLVDLISIKAYFNYQTGLCWDPNWKEVAVYLGAAAGPTDIIVANNPNHNVIKTSFISHYLNRPTIDVQENSPDSVTGSYSTNCEEFVRDIASNKFENIWVVKLIRLPGEILVVENALAANEYKRVLEKGFWENDANTIKYKKFLSTLPFLNYKSAPLKKYLVSVTLYKKSHS